MEKDTGGFGTTKMPNKEGDGYPGQKRSEGDADGFQSGDKPGSIDGAGKGVGKEQGLSSKA